MLKNRFLGISLLLISGIILLSSCAKPPEKEMQEARDAVASAADAEAELYASDLFISAQDSLNQAETFMSEEKYGEAKRLALFAKNWADSAAFMASTNKEEMKASAEKAVGDATSKLESLKKAKVPSKMKTKVDKEIKACETSLSEAKEALEAGNYKDALDKANEVSGWVEKTEGEIIKERGVIGS